MSKKRLNLVGFALFFTATSILHTGYRIYTHNQTLQIPLVNLLKNPDLFPHDPFAFTLIHYCSLLWNFVAWVSKTIPIEPLLLSLFIVERFILFLAAGILASAFAPGRKLAVAGSMAFFALWPQSLIGGGTIMMPYFEQTAFAIPFFILAIAAFYKYKWLAWALFLAIGFNLNSMYGTYAITYFGAAILLDSYYRKQWKQWGKACIVFAFAASPALFLTLRAFGHGAVDNEFWITASMVRLQHHLFPTVWHYSRFIRYALLIVLASIFFLLIRKDSERLYKLGMIWTGVSVLWVAYSFAAVWLKSPAMLVMHPARAPDIWSCFAPIALISAFSISSRVRYPRLWEAGILFSLLIWFALRVPDHLYLALGIAALWIIPGRFIISKFPQRKTALLMGFILAVSLASFVARANRWDSYERAMIWRPAPSITDIGNWACANTDNTDVFLVNPNRSDFRILAKRSVFVTWKDGSAILWYRPYVGEWVLRLQALGYDVSEGAIPGARIGAILDSLYFALSDDDIFELKRRWKLDYWLVADDHESEFPEAYSNGIFKVLDIR